MKCDIYKSDNLSNAYLFVRANTDPIECLSDPVLEKLGKLTFFKTIEFEEDSPLIAADPKEVIDNIKENRFHVQGAEVRIEVRESQDVSEVGAAIGGGILAASLGLGVAGAVIGALIGALVASTAKGDENDPNS